MRLTSLRSTRSYQGEYMTLTQSAGTAVTNPFPFLRSPTLRRRARPTTASLPMSGRWA